MGTLYAENFVGEFGWMLFCWHGYLRKKSRQYDKTIVVCRHGYEYLYEDFAETISEEVDCEDADMWQCKDYVWKSFEATFGTSLKGGDRLISSKRPILRYDHTHKLDNQPLFAKFKEQEFIKLGNHRSGGYDMVFHARSKTNKVNAGMSSNYRNWSQEKWQKLARHFKDLRVATIGSRKGSKFVAGDDLRGANLKLVSNTLASSKALISPSSGPVHLSSLCRCPHVVWWGSPYDKANRNRYEKDWNPFKTPVEAIYCEDWDVSVHQVIEAVSKLKEKS